MMKVEALLPIALVVGIFTLGIIASPLPTADTATVNVTSESKNDDQTLECIMEVIAVMASGSEENMSPKCKAMLGSLRSDSDNDGELATELPATEKSKVDLKLQLQDLTSQLQEPKRDDDGLELTGGDAEEALLDVKRHMSSEDHDEDHRDGDLEKKASMSKSDDIKQAEEEGEDGMEEPFVTNLNSENDDFLIIPLKYLQKQMMSYNDETSDATAAVQSQEDGVAYDGAIEGNANDQREIMAIDEEVKNTAEMDAIDEDRLDALFRVEMDISRLSEDLNRLKTNKPESSSAEV